MGSGSYNPTAMPPRESRLDFFYPDYTPRPRDGVEVQLKADQPSEAD